MLEYLVNHWYLIYDDNCPICLSGVEKVKRLDQAGLIKLTPLSNPRLPAGFSIPDHTELQKQIHLISPDGEVFKGADALARMLTIFPESRFLGKVAAFPVFRPLARLVYAIIAKNRMKLSKLMSSH